MYLCIKQLGCRKQQWNLHLIGGEVLIGGSDSDDGDNETECEWLFTYNSSQMFNSTVNAPSTVVALCACTIDVNKN